MSSSDDVPAIELTDDRETVIEKIQQYAYSGGQSSVDAHREYGGDPDIDVAHHSSITSSSRTIRSSSNSPRSIGPVSC